MAAPTIPYTIPGTVGQSRPELVARVGFASARTADPLSWVDVSGRVRSFQVVRGGENELELIDTGSCSVVLDNRDRALDPFNTSSAYAPNVRPRRRLWLEGQWGGETHDLFYGWTGAFRPAWDGMDAVVELSAVDGFGIASGDALPTSSPPRDSYADVVMFDKPFAYYRLGDTAGTKMTAETGTDGTYRNTPTLGAEGLIVGDTDTCVSFNSASSEDADVIVDAVNFSTGVTAEAWVSISDVGRDHQLIGGPENSVSGVSIFTLGSGTATFRRWLFTVRDATPTTHTIQADAALPVGLSHVVGTWDGSTIRMYVNGVLQSDTEAVASLDAASAGERMRVANNHGGGGMAGYLDEVAVYEYALSAARIAAHYEAGASMGHGQAETDDHVAVAMEESGLHFVPRRLRAGVRDIQPVYFTGQSPREWLDDAVRTEGDPSLCFFAKDGAIVFLDRQHRSASPWSTVQATFDDDGTDLPYLALEIDDGEAFIYNDVRVTARGGVLKRNFDATSIGEYQRRVLDRGETLNVSDADANVESGELLAKYKDPIPRVTALTLKGEAGSAVLSQIIAREIGDRVRVIRRPVGGGSAIDEELFIRKIELSGTLEGDDPYWTARWAVAGR